MRSRTWNIAETSSYLNPPIPRPLPTVSPRISLVCEKCSDPVFHPFQQMGISFVTNATHFPKPPPPHSHTEVLPWQYQMWQLTPSQSLQQASPLLRGVSDKTLGLSCRAAVYRIDNIGLHEYGIMKPCPTSIGIFGLFTSFVFFSGLDRRGIGFCIFAG